MATEVAILLFDNLTALDAVGPYEVLRSLPDSTLRFVAAEPGLKRTDHGALAIVGRALDRRRTPPRHRRHSGRAR